MRSRISILILLLGASIALAQNQVQITQGPKVEHVGSDTAVIAWSTNVSAGTTVKYGTDPNNLTQSAAMPWGGITHRVTVRDLQPNTTYYFRAVSSHAQGSGTEAMSSVAQFQTSASGATATTPVAPTAASPSTTSDQPTSPGTSSPATQMIASQQPSGVQVAAGPIPQHVTASSASIWWETAQPVTMSLKYGTSPTAMKQTAPDTSGGSRQSHRVELKALQAATTYYLALVDSTGREAATVQFTTRAANPTSNTAVDITNGPVIEYISDRQAVIAWSTNQKSSTVVRYGTDPSNLNLSAEAAWAGNATHRVTLNDLQPNTKYWFQIQSAQAQATNPAASSPKYPFQTVQNASAALRFIAP